jgi:hypothetical protein
VGTIVGTIDIHPAVALLNAPLAHLLPEFNPEMGADASG